MDTRRIVILGLFVAIAGVLHAVESWLPLPVPVPGAKLGLANIVSLLAICIYGWRDALLVAVLRVVLGTLLTGTFLGPAFAMGMTGALVSTLGMAYAYQHWRPLFSLAGDQRHRRGASQSGPDRCRRISGGKSRTIVVSAVPAAVCAADRCGHRFDDKFLSGQAAATGCG